MCKVGNSAMILIIILHRYVSMWISSQKEEGKTS